MTQPEPQTIDAWTSLVTAYQVVLDDIEKVLKDASLPKLFWYDVLLEIEKSGDVGIRPFELTERLLLPQYGLSRLLERMVKAGLIVRLDVAEDGRGQTIKLTPDGLRTRQEMWPIYAGSLMRTVEQRLSLKESTELMRLLAKVTHVER